MMMMPLSEQEDPSNSSPSPSLALKRFDKVDSKHPSSPKVPNSSDTEKSEVDSSSGSETSHTSCHSASTAPTQNITAQSNTPTPTEDQSIINTSSEGTNGPSQTDGKDNDQLDAPHDNMEPECVDNKESHVSGSSRQQAEPIDVRNNPSGALAHYEAQLKLSRIQYSPRY
jgi:hypothetical protein